MKKRLITLVLAMVLMAGITVHADETYADVKEEDYFYVSVLFATDKGIINGMGNGQFDPQGILTVAQAIKISACIHADFVQAEIAPSENATHWADCYYDYAVENGIIKDGDFLKADFDKAITRDRLFYIFATSLPESEYPVMNEAEDAPEKNMADYIEKLFCAGIVVGNENGFELEKNITRADTAILISRMCAYSRRQMVLEPMGQ